MGAAKAGPPRTAPESPQSKLPSRRPGTGSIRFTGGGLAQQLRPLAVMKSLELAGMLLFSIGAPRALGPDLFGELAVILSLSGFLAMLCAMGSGQFVFGRFVPEYVTRNEEGRVRALFMHVLLFRVAAALVATPVLYLLLRRLLPSADIATLLASVGAFVAMTLAAPMYAVFFGFNRLALSLTRNALSRFLLLALLLALGASTSLERASYALLLTQLCALAAGVALTRSLFTLASDALDPASMFRHIRFGAETFVSTSLLLAPRQLGETVLGLAGVASAQIGFFNLARSGVEALSELLGQVPHFLIPSLSLSHVGGDVRARDRSLGLSLKYLSILAALGILAMLVTGERLVRLLLGEEFLGVVPHLFVLSGTLLPMPLVRTSFSLSVVRSRTLASMQMGLAAVAVFGLFLLLTSGMGALSVSVSLVASAVAAGIVAAWQMRDTGTLAEARSLRHLLALVGAAAAAVPLSGAPGRGAAAAIVYLLLLFLLRVTSVPELSASMRATLRRSASDSAVDEAAE